MRGGVDSGLMMQTILVNQSVSIIKNTNAIERIANLEEVGSRQASKCATRQGVIRHRKDTIRNIRLIDVKHRGQSIHVNERLSCSLNEEDALLRLHENGHLDGVVKRGGEAHILGQCAECRQSLVTRNTIGRNCSLNTEQATPTSIGLGEQLQVGVHHVVIVGVDRGLSRHNDQLIKTITVTVTHVRTNGLSQVRRGDGPGVLHAVVNRIVPLDIFGTEALMELRMAGVKGVGLDPLHRHVSSSLADNQRVLLEDLEGVLEGVTVEVSPGNLTKQPGKLVIDLAVHRIKNCLHSASDTSLSRIGYTLLEVVATSEPNV